MKRVLGIITVLFFIQCSGKLDSEEIIERSIAYHDPKEQWSTFNGQFSLETFGIFSGDKVDSITINIDHPNKLMRYRNTTRDVDVTYQDTTCIASNGDEYCEGFIWARDFYPYIWGLPMKLKDNMAYINPLYSTKTFGKYPCYQVDVSYPRQDYEFYFNKESYRLEGFRFIQNHDTTKGEIIMHEGEFKLGEVITPNVRKWLDLDSTLLSTDTMKSYQHEVE